MRPKQQKITLSASRDTLPELPVGKVCRSKVRGWTGEFSQLVSHHNLPVFGW